ncbi:Sucrose nonfermenting 2 3 [Hyphodiscus hymeniophilus]|uniref:Sucrose nonfermenting 2 3 n=1 Tax=Hyphodiscus hymeniophilus TaxID=353542 RepID=A0A9P6VRW6_9HELO|nr:Sucrose nonfermenting 2 3 [Hyphodiscus hymeniophilus]
MASRKRSSSWIDLTGDDENPPQKHTRVNQLSSSQPRPSQSLVSASQLERIAWAEDDAGEDIIDLSQDADEGFGWLCVGAIDGKIVGIRYYDGYATVGEQVMVKREPGNPYDSNAIRINNVHGTQIGHLPRNLAAKLSPYMDSRTIVIEGTLAGEKGSWDCPILLKVFGPAEPVARAQLEERMKADRLPLKKRGAAAPKKPIQPVAPPRKSMGYHSSQSSQPSSSQAEPEPVGIQHFVENSERFSPRDAEKIVDHWATGEEALSKMPMADQPEGLLSTLLPYQRQGLAWMLAQENPALPAVGSKDVVQLWKRSTLRANHFQNIATNYNTQSAPKLARGGILADDMGLGKTLQVISTVLEGGPGTTLIIAPVSVMSNWAQQMKRHIKKENAMKVLTYYGGGRRKMTHNDFAEYDVVITSYGTLASEYGKAKSVIAPIPRPDGIFSMNWARVVLDEGHIIRNPTTRNAVAATNLLATRRWVLTGTPIINTIKDLHSMLKFLGITGGLERLELFNAILTRPLAQGSPNAELILQSIMRTMCLRRKKDMKFVDLKLPELSEYVHRIAFRNDEKEKYDALQVEAQGMVKQFQDGKVKNGFDAYRHVLEILLRLRQVCCHWKLCGARVTDLMALLETDGPIALNAENKIVLQALLQLSIDSHDECSICLEELHNPVITACKHVFGGDCIERTIELQHKCPMCRSHLEDASCLVKPAEETTVDADIDVDTKSSKTEALMSILNASRQDPKSKVVIFSQWTSFLDIIQHQVKDAGMKFTRIDGRMPAHARDAAMADLERDPDTRILLASLSVCSVGLNLVAADTVILADSWWAPAIEDQAVDRVHRLGQTRPCTVWRLVMEGSIEERVLDIQSEKRKLVGMAFQEKAKGGKEKITRMGDILKLLEMRGK